MPSPPSSSGWDAACAAAINHVGKPHFSDCSKHSFNNLCFFVNNFFSIYLIIYTYLIIYITFSESHV